MVEWSKILGHKGFIQYKSYTLLEYSGNKYPGSLDLVLSVVFVTIYIIFSFWIN